MKSYLLMIDRGWSGGATVLGKLPVPGRPTILIIVGQGPTSLAVGAGGGCLDIFSLVYHFSFLTPSLWETARYRLKYCLKGPLSPNQPTNQPTNVSLMSLVTEDDMAYNVCHVLQIFQFISNLNSMFKWGKTTRRQTM